MSVQAGAEIDNGGMDIMRIMRLLPHRFPFLLIDRIESVYRPGGKDRVGTKIVAIKNVTFNEPYFQGHFPSGLGR